MPRTEAQFINVPFQDVRQELLTLGLTGESATLALPQVWQQPGTSDRYSPGIIMLVQALQYQLARLGYPNVRNGYVDPATDRALAEICGPHWQTKPWIAVIGEVIRAPARTDKPMRNGSLGSLGGTSLGVDVGNILGTFVSGVQATSGPVKKIRSMTWTVSGGVCTPSDGTTLTIFKDLQRQTNRILSAFKGGSTIAEDGKLGPKSIDAVQRAGRALSVRAVTSKIATALLTDCTSLSMTADLLAAEWKRIADGAGAAAAPSTPVPKERAVFDPATNQLTYKPTLASLLPFDLTPTTMLVGAAGIGLALAIWKKRKQKQARS
jgi:hypothetical protein